MSPLLCFKLPKEIWINGGIACFVFVFPFLFFRLCSCLVSCELRFLLFFYVFLLMFFRFFIGWLLKGREGMDGDGIHNLVIGEIRADRDFLLWSGGFFYEM